MINVGQVASELKDWFTRTEADAHSFLELHAPGLAEVAQKLDGDPLVQAALTATLPDDARAALAEIVTKFAAAYPQPAPAAPADPAMGEPAATPA
jgi:hypothetical protein